MSSIIATLTARPGAEKKLEEILRALVAATAQEPGAVVYDILRPDDRPNAFVAVERYRDAAARTSHLQSRHLTQALECAKDLLAREPELTMLTPMATIRHQVREFEGRQVLVDVLPLGRVNLVYAQTQKGLLACGAIDPGALEKFGIAAARVKPAGESVATFEDLLAGTVREANEAARLRGIAVGMTGREALTRL